MQVKNNKNWRKIIVEPESSQLERTLISDFCSKWKDILSAKFKTGLKTGITQWILAELELFTDRN